MTAWLQTRYRWIWATGVCCVAIALLVIVVDLRQQMATANEMLAQREVLLSRLTASIAESRRYVNSDAPGNSHHKVRQSFLHAEDEAQALSQLQTDLRQILSASNMTFVSSRALPRRVVDDVVFLGVKLEGTSDLRALQAGLFALETAEPKLIIDVANIAAVPEPPNSKRAGDRLLRWQFDIYAALWGSGS